MLLLLLATAALVAKDSEVAENQRPVDNIPLVQPSTKTEVLNRIYKMGTTGERQQAIEHLYILISEDPDFYDARKLLALFLEWEHNYDAAIVQIDYVLHLQPHDPDALLIKAEVLKGMGRCEQAVSYYERALDFKQSYKAQMGLAYCLVKTGHVIRARAVAEDIEPATAQERDVLAEFLGVTEQSQAAFVVNRAYEYVDCHSYECALLLLEEYLCGNPCDDQVRLELARIYGLNDDFDRGIEQACCLIDHDPQNMEAWILLADLYRWKGDYITSVSLYNYLLEDSGCSSDEASLGLAYAYLGIGNRSGAHQIACRLQDDELFDAIEKRPFIDATYRYLTDSQDLDISQFSTKYVWWRGNCVFDLNYMHIDSDSPGFGGYLDQAYFRAYAPVTTQWDFGASAGFAHVNSRAYFIGEAEALWRLCSSTLYQRGGYYIYNETAEALDNRIRYGSYYINYTYNLTDRQFTGAFYEYRKYSDGNHINYIDLYYDILLFKRAKSGCSCIPFNPEFEFRYDIAWQDAAENALNGYFSGQNYLENRGALAIRFYNKKNELRVELIPTLAYVTYKDFTRHLNDVFYGGIANIYAQLKEQLLLIVGVKAGKYPFQGPDEYDYQEYAVRLIYEF